MPKIKTPTFVKSLLAKPNRLAKLTPVVFVVIFAAIGTVYLVASHAATPSSPQVTLSGTNYGGWYRASTTLTVNYHPICVLSPAEQQVSVPISSPGSHTYYIWQDSHYQPWMSIDTTASIHFMTGVSYSCGMLLNPNTSNLTLAWSGAVRIDNTPPSVSFASTNSTTSNSTVTVTGSDSDPGGSGVASVQVNGVGATLSGGSFTANVPVSLGANALTATASDVVGYTTRSGTITVNRVAPPPPAPKAPSSGSSSSSSGSKPSTPKSTSSSSGSGAAAPSGSSTTTPAAGSDTTSSDNSDANDVASLSQPNVPNDSSSTLTSYDNLVKVTFPAGAFGTDAYCTVDTALSSTVPVNVKPAQLIGPYDIACTDANGQSLSVLKKPISVNITTPSGTAKYAGYTNGNNKWSKVAGSTSSKKLSFKLTSIKTFAAAPGSKAGISGTVILNIVGALVVILIVGGGAFLIHLRNKQYANPNP